MPYSLHDVIQLAANHINNYLKKTKEFNNKVIGMPVPERPQVLELERLNWALTAFQEEINEFKKAHENNDVIEAADALIDLCYFVLGRLIEMGVPPGPIFDEVHARNMEKRRGELSKRPGSKGYDAIKPLGWTKPDHSWLLLNYKRTEAD